MPLQHVDGEVILELAGISFAMLDGRTRVPVFVTYVAIEDIEQPRPSDHAESLQRFQRRRSDFELIASKKFDGGQVEDDGSVRVGKADLP